MPDTPPAPPVLTEEEEAAVATKLLEEVDGGSLIDADAFFEAQNPNPPVP